MFLHISTHLMDMGKCCFGHLLLVLMFYCFWVKNHPFCTLHASGRFHGSEGQCATCLTTEKMDGHRTGIDT